MGSYLISYIAIYVSLCCIMHKPFIEKKKKKKKAGSLLPSVFSLSTQLLVLAYIIRHTVGTRASAAYNFRCRCPHSCYPCTVSAHTPTVLPGYLLVLEFKYQYFVRTGTRRAQCSGFKSITLIYGTTYDRYIAIEHTSVGLAHARPNYNPMQDELKDPHNTRRMQCIVGRA